MQHQKYQRTKANKPAVIMPQLPQGFQRRGDLWYIFDQKILKSHLGYCKNFDSTIPPTNSTTPESTFFVDVFQKAKKLFDFSSTVPSNTKLASIDHAFASTEIGNVTEWVANPVAPRTTVNFTEYSSTIDDRDDSLLNSTIFEQNNTVVTFPISLTSSAPKINIDEQVLRITVEMTATKKPTDTKSTDSSNFKE
uniref:Uncharacterized protein n=1 Tax=Romanomermis culicivorax TaxID=13658 RepID=A0A915JK53_ROMCU